MRCGDIAGDWNAGGVLAGVFELAREIFAGVRRGVAAGPASDGARLLRAGSDGTTWAAGKTVDRAFRARIGVHLRRIDPGIGPVQFSVCGAAASRFVRRRGSQTAECLSRTGCGRMANILASDPAALLAGSGDGRGAEFRAHPW